MYCYSVQSFVSVSGNSIFIVFSIRFSKVAFMQPSHVPLITTLHPAASVLNQILALGSLYQGRPVYSDCTPNISIRCSKLARLEQLEELDLSGNKLKAVPTTILSCQRLHTLAAHSNCISTFPEVLQLPEIKVSLLRRPSYLLGSNQSLILPPCVLEEEETWS